MNPARSYRTSPMIQLHLLGALAAFCLKAAQLVITKAGYSIACLYLDWNYGCYCLVQLFYS